MRKEWKTKRIDADALEKFLNLLEQEGKNVHSTTMDQANGEWVVVYWVEDTQLLSD